MNIIKGYIVLAVVLTLFSCERYDGYTKDYDNDAVYVSSQKPLRTIVADDLMKFEFGVAYGGVRSNNKTVNTDFKIDPTLLTTVKGADKFTLMPKDYYKLSNDKQFIVSPGSFLGTVTCTLDKKLFTQDPLAVTNTYAIPFKVSKSSADKILDGKDYGIIVVKYISPFSGTYYEKGVQYTLDQAGNPTKEDVYSNKNLSQNELVKLSTSGLNIVNTSDLGADLKSKIELTVNDDNTVAVTSSAVTINKSACTYDKTKESFYLDMTLEKSHVSYHVVDTLILRQKPELDLRFEEWK